LTQSPDPLGQPVLDELRARLEVEEDAYAEVLAAVDRLASFELPAEAAPEAREKLERLNALWSSPPRPSGGGLGGALRQRAWDAVLPAIERQAEFNAALVQLLNARLAQRDRLDASLRLLASSLVHYAQRVQPLVDASDRMASAVTTTRSELILEAFDRRLEALARTHGGWLQAHDGSLQAHAGFLQAHAGFLQAHDGSLQAHDSSLQAHAGWLKGFEQRLLALEHAGQALGDVHRRLEALLAMRDRLETLSEQMRAVRGSLAAGAPAPALAAVAVRAADDALYTAFENRFRGSREELAKRQARDVEMFRGLGPVVDLGCGRGEFLQLLKDGGIEARGVETNANVVHECRAKGLDVVQGDLLTFLRSHGDRSLGGIFAAQVVEHLPPPVLLALLAEAHRVLAPGGRLLLETVNARSAVAFLEVYIRDLTHEKPLHSETLAFLAAAQGFSEVRIETRAPIPDEGRLHHVEAEGLPHETARVLNENFERLNGLLYGPLDYALIARR